VALQETEEAIILNIQGDAAACLIESAARISMRSSIS